METTRAIAALMVVSTQFVLIWAMLLAGMLWFPVLVIWVFIVAGVPSGAGILIAPIWLLWWKPHWFDWFIDTMGDGIDAVVKYGDIATSWLLQDNIQTTTERINDNDNPTT